MLIKAVIGVIALFVVLAVAIGLWARGQMRGSHAHDARQHYIELASAAANDESGRALLTLLQALDTAGADCPVTIDWIPRESTRAGAPELLVRIAWDGNEWRRLFAIAALRERLNGYLAESPALKSRGAEKLLAALA